MTTFSYAFFFENTGIFGLKLWLIISTTGKFKNKNEMIILLEVHEEHNYVPPAADGCE